MQQARAAVIEDPDVEIFASDYDTAALQIAASNAARAGVEQLIQFSHQQVGELEFRAIERNTAICSETLVICNPPYGQRLQAEQGLAELYGDLGAALRRLAPARLAIISANPDMLHRLQLNRLERKDVRNGPIECLFAQYATVAAGDAPPRWPRNAEVDSSYLCSTSRLPCLCAIGCTRMRNTCNVGRGAERELLPGL